MAEWTRTRQQSPLLLLLNFCSFVSAIHQMKDPRMTLGKELYGGILDNFMSLPANDTDVLDVAKFAAEFARKRHPSSFPVSENGQISPWQVLEPKKLKLHFTKDGRTPFIFEEIRQGSNGPLFYHRQAVLGIIYTFTLTWEVKYSSIIHKFVVNKDRERRLFVYSHHFYSPIRDIVPQGKLQRMGASKVRADDFHIVRGGGSGPVHLAARSDSDLSECSPDAVGMAAQISRSVENSGSGGQLSNSAQSESCNGRTHHVWTKNGLQKDRIATTCTVQKDLMFGKITTYNIWNFNSLYPGEHKFYAHRMNQMGKLLADSGSDIIGMQEVRYSHEYSDFPGPCQVAQLAEHLMNYQYIYQPAVNHWQGHLGRSEEGLAIFSKHPILSQGFILLPRNKSDPEDSGHQRICLHAEIEHSFLGIVHVFVSHLSLSRVARERSVVEIWRYMQHFSGLALLMGDFNAEPHEKSMSFLRGETELHGHRTDNLVDAWRFFYDEPRPDAPYTYREDEPRDIGLTFSAIDKHLRKRIDYIYVRLTDDTKLQDVSLVDDGKRGHQAASDHIGVSAVIVPSSVS
ncbi:uncharacterized protein [Diadema setosum]|uniref:uncharacterized protein isoform X1 n=1 Tax=Diadema setosum TaxID=31175 RepID=UPI003B39FD91